jgi:cobalt-precorrin 5A hydrolase
MECGEVKVAGLGFKRDVTLASLREALVAAGGGQGLAAVATLDDRTETPALQSLAREFDLPIRAVSAEMLEGIATSTQSEFVKARFGTGSVAEAAALAAAGPGSRLISKRTVSQDRTATAAVAEGEGE